MTARRRLRRALATGLLGLVVAFAASPSFARGRASEEAFSDTVPPVNVRHLFEGEVNRRGRPTGFHARPGGRNPENARVTAVVSPPNRAGVYEADVEIRAARGGRWLRKRSTFFPDSFSRKDVLDAVLAAYRRARPKPNSRFRGDGGRGFAIEGYTLPNGDVNTAYPIYTR